MDWVLLAGSCQVWRLEFKGRLYLSGLILRWWAVCVFGIILVIIAPMIADRIVVSPITIIIWLKLLENWTPYVTKLIWLSVCFVNS